VAILITAEPGEAHSRAQFPELGLLRLGDTEGFAIQVLGGLGTPLPQQQLAFVPVQLRCEKALRCRFDNLQSSPNKIELSSICPAISHALAKRAI